jgi:hypothetical protein
MKQMLGSMVRIASSLMLNTSYSVYTHILSSFAGFWSYDWADNYVQIDKITPTSDGQGSEIFVNPNTPPVYGFVVGAKFFGINLMSEVDVATEYAFDAVTNMLNFIPPDAIQGSESFLSIASNAISIGELPADNAFPSRKHTTMDALTGPVSNADDGTGYAASYITIDGFSLFFSRGIAILAQNVSNIALSRLNVSNHAHTGVVISGSNNTLVDSEVLSTGCEAVAVSGGNELTLVSGFNTVARTTISNYARMCRTYQPGIGWSGVGNTFANNNITNGPHSGFLGFGNNNMFVGNYLADLCYEVSDSGGWYSGRSWVRRGNVIFNNTFVRINNTEGYTLGTPSVQAVYLDDQLSGTLVLNNTFIDCPVGVVVGGGRDTTVFGNMCVHSIYCVHFDARGLGWQAPYCAYNATYTGLLVEEMFQVNYTYPPFSTEYPSLPDTLQYHPCTPVDVNITYNTLCTGPQTVGFIDASSNETTAWLDFVNNNTVSAC